MSGNLFEDRNWLLPPNYLDNDNDNKIKNEPKIVTSVTSPKPPIKEEELRVNDQEKCNWATDWPFLQIPEERGREQATAAEDIAKNTKTGGQKTQFFEPKHD